MIFSEIRGFFEEMYLQTLTLNVYSISLQKRDAHLYQLHASRERWGAGVETQKNVRGEIEGWGRVPFHQPFLTLNVYSMSLQKRDTPLYQLHASRPRAGGSSQKSALQSDTTFSELTFENVLYLASYSTFSDRKFSKVRPTVRLYIYRADF